MLRPRVNTFDTTMSPPTNSLLVSKEAQIQLAIYAFNTGQIIRLRPTAYVFNIPLLNLKTRRNGITL